MKLYIPHILTLTVIALSSCTSTPPPAEPSEPEAEHRIALEMVTDYGTMQLELYNETPKHRDNFAGLANEGAFDSLLFHRVIETFMIQSGDPDSKYAEPGAPLGNGDRDYLVDQEMRPDVFHKKGTLAAARDGNPDRGSSAMQFYIVQGQIYNDSTIQMAEDRVNMRLAMHYYLSEPEHLELGAQLYSLEKAEDWDRWGALKDSIKVLSAAYTDFERHTISDEQREVYKTIGGTPTLDQSYTAFGQVTSGLAVIDSIAATATDSLDRPIDNVRIHTVRVLE